MNSLYYDLVVLIDCWPTKQFESRADPTLYSHKFYKGMLKKLSELQFDNVAIATYSEHDHVEHNECLKFTDPYVLANIRSKNNHRPLCKPVHNFRQLYTAFPNLVNINPYNVIVAGLSFSSCVHWRSLGMISWILQDHMPYTHPNLVWFEGTDPDKTPVKILDDPCVHWFSVSDDADHMYRAYGINKAITLESS